MQIGLFEFHVDTAKPKGNDKNIQPTNNPIKFVGLELNSSL